MEDPENPIPAVQSLRDAFGDHRPPDISRKITACVACRKQKIKCHMPSSGPPCTRCRKRNLSCTVNRSLQMLLENDTTWKHAMETEIQKLKEAVQQLANQASLSGLAQSLQDVVPSSNTRPEQEERTDVREETTQWEIVVDADSGLEAPPGSYLSQPVPKFSQNHGDIISRGIIRHEDAQTCLNLYQKRLDHFPYRILGDHGNSDLDTIRAASPFLLTAICCVSNLHMNTGNYEACYQDFTMMYAVRNFVKDHTVDDVRALCIGAFWLSDISWALVGTAVRIATDLQLQKSFNKALQGDRAHYLRARLYLLVYACDHHFSIPFGRPPMTRECHAIRNVRKFLNCVHTSEDDARLVSQVLRWSLCTNVFDTYGTDTSRPLAGSDISQLREFNMSLDSLRVEWGNRFTTNVYVGAYPAKGVNLQCDYAKLYLCSHAFRGTDTTEAMNRTQDASLAIDGITHEGIISSLAIVQQVISNPEIQSFFNGLPIYFDIMLASAVVFLFKISTRISTKFRIDIQATKRSVADLLVILKGVATELNPHHLLVSLVKGIERLIQRWGTENEGLLSEELSRSQEQRLTNGPAPDVQLGWFDGLLDPLFMGEFGSLMDQGIDYVPNLPLGL